MNKLMSNIESYRGFINIVFGILIAIIGYFVVNKLNDINDSIKELQRLQTEQLIQNEKFSGEIRALTNKVNENTEKIENLKKNN